MSDIRQFRYGWKLRRLIVPWAAALAASAFLCSLALSNRQLIVFMMQVPNWLSKLILLFAAALVFGGAVFHICLVAYRFHSPQVVGIDQTAITVPTSMWRDERKTVPFASIQNVVGPRAGKLEIRTRSHTYALDAPKFESETEFRECCQILFKHLGLNREIVGTGNAPKYCQIANQFATGPLSEYYGSVIASADAFFLVRLKNYQQRYKAITEGIADVVERVSRKEQIEIPISSLPETVLNHHDWPLWDRDGTVRVVPKEAIKSVTFPWWGALKLKTADWRFAISVPMWKQKAARRYLRNVGWDI
jgi:hypothetical protein